MDQSRRSTLKKLATGTAGITIGGLGFSAKSYAKIQGANDRLNLCVIGTRGRGFDHIGRWAGMAKEQNILLKTICDVDENLFAERVQAAKELQGEAPGTEVDMRNVFADKDIDAVSIATPNHWHALATIWACQAGKHVYVEKPCSHNIYEGRKMIEAARKYNRIVQVGFQNRSINNVRRAMQFLHDGGIGDVFLARGLCYKPRDSFGKVANSTPPEGLHYDLWLGPDQYKPYNELHLHYNWHWFWDTGNGDIGNQGPHQFDIARWGLNKNEHPVKAYSSGGYYAFGDVCDQQTANTQAASFTYADGKILEFEVRGLYTGGESGLGVKIGNIFYGTKGYLELDGSNWKTYMGREQVPGPNSEDQEAQVAAGNGGQDLGFMPAPGGDGHYQNFLRAVRSGKMEDLNCDIEEGFRSTVLPHLANISYRLGREVKFDGANEKFIKDKEANKMLSRKYREPFVVEENV